jgi:Transaldolase.
VDSHIDPRLQAIGTPDALALAGKAAVANARLAYAQFLQVFDSGRFERLDPQVVSDIRVKTFAFTPELFLGSERFAELAAKGARKQRPLWASTSTKNPAYRDVMYVEELVGADTVNTVPPQTLTAFLDHGKARESIGEDLDAARALFVRLEELGIMMPQVTAQLEAEGVKAFADAFGVLLEAVEARRKA